MPYITKKDRNKYDGMINSLTVTLGEAHPGHLNYIISKLLKGTEPSCYADYNTLIGVLECAKLEMYRHIVGPYEDKAIKKNGDI